MSLLTLEPLVRLVQARPELGGPFDPARLEPAWTPLRTGLQRLAETARTGGCCLITGPAGSGKTVLLETFGWALETGEDTELTRPLAAFRNWLVLRIKGTAQLSMESLLMQALRERGVEGADPWTALEANLPRWAGGAILIDRFDALLAGDRPAGVRHLLELAGARRLPLLVAACTRPDPRREAFLFQHFPTVCSMSLPGRPGEWEGLVARRALARTAALPSHPDLDYQVSSLLHLNVYKSQSAEWLRRQVVEGGYPLHPAALFALPRLAMLAGSSERNAFRFFADTERGGLTYFINNSTVAQPQGQLSLFTLDALYGYFQSNLAVRFLDQTRWLADTLARAHDIPLARRLLHCAWLLQLLGHERMPLRPDVLLWAAHLSERELAVANRGLKLLIGNGLMQFDATQGTLRLDCPFPPPPAEDSLVPHLPEDFDLYEMLARQPPPARLQTFEVNARLHTDRYVRVKLARPEQLARAGWLEQQLAPLHVQEPYQGDLLLLYVAVHDGLEREALRELMAAGGACADGRLVLAWPQQDYPWARDARRIRALELLLEGRYPFCDPLSPRHTELEQQVELARSALNRQVRELLAPQHLDFHTGGHTTRAVNLTQFHQFLNARVLAILGRPPVVPEKLFSTVAHPQRQRKRRLRCLDYLLRSGPSLLLVKGEPLHEPLWAALRSTGLLERAEAHDAWESCLMSTGKGPLGQALALLESHLAGAGLARSGIDPGPVLATLAAPPYSLPAATRELLLAVVCWRHQGALRRAGQAPTARDVMEIVAEPAQARLEYRPVDPELVPYLAGLAQDLDPGWQPVEGVSPWRPAARRLVDWFSTLSPQSLILGRERTPFNAALIDLMQRPGQGEGNERALLEDELPAALGRTGDEPWGVILERFRLVRRSLARALPATRGLIHLGLRQVFASTAPGDEERGWPGLIAAWYSRLPRSVRDEPQDDVLKAFLGACVDADEDETLDDLLGELGYPHTSSWTRDYTPEIIERVRLARSEMDYADFLGFYPVAPHLRAATAVELIRRMLNRSELGVQELEEVLQGELEQVALHWP